MIKKIIKNILTKTPFFQKFFIFYFDYWSKSCYPAGHFYSPIVNMEDVEQEEWMNPQQPEAIELNDRSQIDLLNKLSFYLKDVNIVKEPEKGRRYYSNNSYFKFTDAIILKGMIGVFRSEKIIEVGSGFSSAVMLDMLDEHPELNTQLCFIEPHPDRLNSLISNQDRQKTKIYNDNVQKIPLTIFEALNQNDMLFIDSSHVSKTGSDLNYLIFKILPRLKKGVIIHFHDVFYPFEYPLEWVKAGRNWNEDYLIKSFLMYNSIFEILFFNDYMHYFHANLMKEKLPFIEYCTGGSLWMQKIK
jgi:predicted O-methyltransferase YrrM